MIRRIGCRAHDYGKGTIEALSAKIAGDGYRTTQLALKKAILGGEDLILNLNMARAVGIESAMSEKNLDISVLGAYLNYAHPDGEARLQNIRILEEHLKIAKAMGARMVGTETGSLDESYNAHEGNHGEVAYLRFKDAIEQVMPLAHEYDTYMAVEAVAHHILHTPERMERFVDDIDDERLWVIFDINNIITPDNWQKQDEMINRMFDKLGPKITAVHVKDFDIIDGEKVIVPMGEGKLNLDLLIGRAEKSPMEVDVLAENIPAHMLEKTYMILSKFIHTQQ